MSSDNSTAPSTDIKSKEENDKNDSHENLTTHPAPTNNSFTAAMPQSTSASPEKKKPPSIKIKFPLSILNRRKLDDEEEDTDANDDDEEDDDAIVNTNSASSNANNDASSEAASSIASLNNPSSTKKEDEDVRMGDDQAEDDDEEEEGEVEEGEVEEEEEVEEGQITSQDVDMEDNDEVSMDSSPLPPASHTPAEKESVQHEEHEDDEITKDPEDDTEEKDDVDADNSLAEDENSQEDGDDANQLQDKDSQSEVDDKENNVTGTEGNINRTTRTSSAYDSNENEKDKSKEDDASLDTSNNINSSSSNNFPFSRATERDILGFREPTTASTTNTTSFLDSLSEEQRRVRTRHLPDVSGFRRLHKNQIKRDLAYVRKVLKCGTTKEKNGSNVDEGTIKDDSTETESMDVDKSSIAGTVGTGTSTAQVSGDDSQSDDDFASTSKATRLKTNTNEPNPDLYNIFSLPFIQSPYICTDVAFKSSNMQNAEGHPPLFSSPQVVESINAFNPPRPPESVGPKKMHRLHRWESKPEDVEVDLNCYRKTVNRTRQELHKAEIERERIEVVGAHLRSHLLTQLKCMRYEMDLLNQQYDSTQIKCVKAAELLTSKTRSRGVARGSSVMKDVISVLKSRGEKIDIDANETKFEPWCTSGIGGISFKNETSTTVGSGWILPGDKVSSPYGIGTVKHVCGPSEFNSKDAKSASSKNNPPQSQLSPTEALKEVDLKSTNVLPRVCVDLPFGMGYFSPEYVSLVEGSASLKDDKLCARWMAMLESAQMMSSTVDSIGVENCAVFQRLISQESEEKVDGADVDDLTETSAVPDTGNNDMEIDNFVEPSSNSDVENNRLASFGVGLLPSSKALASDVSLEKLENDIEMMLSKSTGVTGARNNPRVPPVYRKWENTREELRILEGEAMQLSNKVYRQKRIRYLNEKSCSSNQDKSDRFEVLLNEMKADLDILKKRLNDELFELGIDQAHAEALLAEYNDMKDEENDDEEEYEEGSLGGSSKVSRITIFLITNWQIIN